VSQPGESFFFFHSIFPLFNRGNRIRIEEKKISQPLSSFSFVSLPPADTTREKTREKKGKKQEGFVFKIIHWFGLLLSLLSFKLGGSGIF
jgi:hypothetical protein